VGGLFFVHDEHVVAIERAQEYGLAGGADQVPEMGAGHAPQIQAFPDVGAELQEAGGQPEPLRDGVLLDEAMVAEGVQDVVHGALVQARLPAELRDPIPPAAILEETEQDHRPVHHRNQRAWISCRVGRRHCSLTRTSYPVQNTQTPGARQGLVTGNGSCVLCVGS